jgi:hypothetical protein
MKTLKIFLGLLFFGIFSFSIYSCTKDIIADNGKDFKDKIARRDLSLGNYSIVDGRIKFETHEDFSNTLKYLSMADSNQLNNFRNSISIETSAKAYYNFMIAIDNIESSTETIDDIENQFRNKIKIITSRDGEKEYDKKYVLFNEIFNLNGEVQVDNSIIKVIGNKLFTIFDFNNIDLNEINENTQTDSLRGIFASILETDEFQLRSSCPLSNEEVIKYTNDDSEYRITRKYKVIASIGIVAKPKQAYYKFPFVEIQGSYKVEKHKRFIWRYWGNYKADLFCYNFRIEVLHNWHLYGIDNPIIVQRGDCKKKTYYIEHLDYYESPWLHEMSATIIPSNVRVKEVIQNCYVEEHPESFNSFGCQE